MQHHANTSVYYFTSEIGTTSLQGTKLLAPKCPLFRGFTVLRSHTGMAAEFCREVGGKRLILIHFSQRYHREGEEVGEGEEGVGEEGVGKLLGEALIGTGIRMEIADNFKTFVIPAKKT